MRVILAAVAGTGFIGPVHVEAVRRLGHRVVGILGSTAEKSQAAASALGIERGYSSFAELLSDPAVEVVHIATPNRFHSEQCKAALKAGKHVICEKPLAMNSIETAELVRLAETHQELMTAVNYNVRFSLCLEARARIQSGQAGEVYHVTGSYLQDWLFYPTDFNWRILAQDGGDLRAVADIGTHWLDLVTFITGLDIAEVCADLRTVHPNRQQPVGGTETFSGSAGGNRGSIVPVTVATEDYGSVLLRFTTGARGCVTVSQVNAGRKNRIHFEIACSKSALAWDSENPETLHLGHRDRANEVLSRDPAILSPGVRRHADYPGGHVEGFADTFKQLYKAIYDAIATGIPSPLVPTFADGHREVLICEAVLKSHRSGRWEPVG